MIRVAAMNRGWWFENFIIRNIETNRGRAAAQKSLFISGALMVLIGVWTLVAPWLKQEVAPSQVPEPTQAMEIAG